jgi:hypothetical protein
MRPLILIIMSYMVIVTHTTFHRLQDLEHQRQLLEESVKVDIGGGFLRHLAESSEDGEDVGQEHHKADEGEAQELHEKATGSPIASLLGVILQPNAQGDEGAPNGLCGLVVRQPASKCALAHTLMLL